MVVYKSVRFSSVLFCLFLLQKYYKSTKTNLWLQAFAQLLQAPRDDGDQIIKERFPVPRLVICDQHGSQVILMLSCSINLLDVKPKNLYFWYKR